MVGQVLPESVLDWSNPDLLGDPYWGSSSLLGGFVGLAWVSLTAPERRRFTNVAISYWAAVPWRDIPHTDSDGRLIGRYPAGMKVLRDSLVEAGTQQLYLASANSFEQGCIAAFVALVRWVWESDAKPLTPERAEGGRRESLILGASGFASSVNTDARSVINHLPLQTQNWILSSGLLRDDARSGRGARPVALDSVGGAVGSAATSDSVVLLQAEISEIDGRLDALEVSEITGVERAMLDGLTFPYGFDGTLTLDENVDEPGEVLLSTNDVPPEGQTATNFLLVETEPYKTQGLLRGCGVGNYVRVRMADGSAELIVKVAYAEDSSTDANDRYLWYTAPLYSRGLDQYGQLPAGAMRLDFTSSASPMSLGEIVRVSVTGTAWTDLVTAATLRLAEGVNLSLESESRYLVMLVTADPTSASDHLHPSGMLVARVKDLALADVGEVAAVLELSRDGAAADGSGGAVGQNSPSLTFGLLATGTSGLTLASDTWKDTGIDISSSWGLLFCPARYAADPYLPVVLAELPVRTDGQYDHEGDDYLDFAKTSSGDLLAKSRLGDSDYQCKAYGYTFSAGSGGGGSDVTYPPRIELQRFGAGGTERFRVRLVDGTPSVKGFHASLYLVNKL